MATNVNEIQAGDVFSEMSHYVYQGKSATGHILTHLESKENVVLSDVYVSNLLKTADIYDKEVKVGKEDKLWTAKQISVLTDSDLKDLGGITPRVGDIRVKGIRTIWEEIHSSQVFTVAFKKVDTPKTKKAYAAELEAQRELTIDMIDKAKKQKKSMAEAYRIALEYIQMNPVKDYVEGEIRLLRGYKVQFTSRDGKYDCIDMDIEMKGTESGLRPVNINTIQFLVFDGIKYVVE
jgi:hypothetical protein